MRYKCFVVDCEKHLRDLTVSAKSAHILRKVDGRKGFKAAVMLMVMSFLLLIKISKNGDFSGAKKSSLIFALTTAQYYCLPSHLEFVLQVTIVGLIFFCLIQLKPSEHFQFE